MASLENTIIVPFDKFNEFLNEYVPQYVDNTSEYLLNHHFTFVEKLQGKNKGKGGLILGNKLMGKDNMRIQVIIQTKDKILKDLKKKDTLELDDFPDMKHKGIITKQETQYKIEIFLL